MSHHNVTPELLERLKADRDAIGEELPDLARRDRSMREAAEEDTLSGHLRRAVHQSKRPLKDIARDAGLTSIVLCDFLEGERTLRSDVLDRVMRATGASVSVTLPSA